MWPLEIRGVPKYFDAFSHLWKWVDPPVGKSRFRQKPEKASFVFKKSGGSKAGSYFTLSPPHPRPQLPPVSPSSQLPPPNYHHNHFTSIAITIELCNHSFKQSSKHFHHVILQSFPWGFSIALQLCMRTHRGSYGSGYVQKEGNNGSLF